MKIVLIYFVFTFTCIFSQKVIVRSALDNSEIENLILITDSSTHYLEFSEFYISDYTQYELIRIEHLAYQSFNFSLNSKNRVIYLKPKIFVTMAELVESKANHNFRRRRLSSLEKESKSLAQIIKQESAFNISSYGGSGSLQELKYNGLSGHHSAVMIEGFKINNSQNGVVNLSSLFLSHFNQVDFYTEGSNVLKTADAIAGGIDLSIASGDESYIQSSMSYGSYHRSSAALETQVNVDKIQLSFNHSRDESQNYFPYWKNDSELAYRNHADYRRNQSSITALFQLNPKSTTKAIYMNSYLNAGTPGAKRNLNIDFEEGELRQIDHYELYLLNTSYLLNHNHELSTGFQYQNEKQIYNSTAIYLNSKKLFRIRDRFSFNEMLHLESFIEVQNSKLDGNTGSADINASRNQLSFGNSFNLAFSESLSVNTAYRKSVVNSKDILIYNLHSSYQTKNQFFFSYSFSSQKRIPSFNELYWPEAGNRYLFDEKAIMRSFLIAKKIENFHLELSYFHNSYWDFIEWYNDGFSRLHVENINNYKQRGIRTKLEFKEEFFKIDLNYSHQLFNNKTQERLNFPNQVLSVNSHFSYDKFELLSNYRINSPYKLSYTIKEAPIRHLWDLSFSVAYPFQKSKLKLFIEANNLLDIKSQAHIAYPEANRNIRLGISFNYKIKEKNESYKQFSYHIVNYIL